jgi:hypothetical protein
VESVAELIAAAVKTLVEPLAAGVPHVVRDLPDWTDGDPDDLVVVSVLDDDADPADFDNDRPTYTAVVTRVTKRQGKLNAGGTPRRWKQAARRALHTPYLTGTPVVHTEVLSRSPFPRAGVGAQVNYTAVAVRYTTLEPRG